MADLESATAWLRHARSDLALACAEAPSGVLLEHLLYHAQQAAEKGLKAVLLHRGEAVPRTHDIAFLLDLVAHGETLPHDIDGAGALTIYAVETRYPADLGEVTEEEAAEARQMAARVVAWATVQVSAPPRQSDQ